MGGHELAVEQGEAADLEARDQPGQRHLGGVGGGGEHAFPEEGPAELDAVEATDEFAVPPDLDRMGVTGRVQGQYGLLDLGVDPSLFASRTCADDGGEIAVEGDGERP